jgi:hypothetical protein
MEGLNQVGVWKEGWTCPVIEKKIRARQEIHRKVWTLQVIIRKVLKPTRPFGGLVGDWLKGWSPQGGWVGGMNSPGDCEEGLSTPGVRVEGLNPPAIEGKLEPTRWGKFGTRYRWLGARLELAGWSGRRFQPARFWGISPCWNVKEPYPWLAGRVRWAEGWKALVELHWRRERIHSIPHIWPLLSQ